MRTWSGTRSPLSDDGRVEILDIVVHLGREPRFGGFGDREWTVLHHSMLCSLIWLQLGYDPRDLAKILLHDAHEHITGDIPRPVKRRIREAAMAGNDPLGDVERELDARIRVALRLEKPDPEVAARIKFVDRIALLIEAVVFGPPGTAADVLAYDIPPDQVDGVIEIARSLSPAFWKLYRRGKGETEAER